MDSRIGEVEALLSELGEAVGDSGAGTCCRRVERALVRAVTDGGDFLAPDMVAPLEETYARRLLHLDPEGRYSVVVMAWGPGQRTPLHDHDGHWCVECVYRGRIRVHSYQLVEELPGPLFRFALESRIEEGIGNAGALIPPFEYHSLENPHRDPAATIHVYRGELRSCRVYLPAEDDSYRAGTRLLGYS